MNNQITTSSISKSHDLYWKAEDNLYNLKEDLYHITEHGGVYNYYKKEKLNKKKIKTKIDYIISVLNTLKEELK